MTIDKFLKACGRMHRTDVNVGFSRAPLSEITYFWLDRGDRYVRTHVTGLELIQNAVQYELMQGPEYEPGCNPRCWLEHPKGFDTLHVGPDPDVVFKMGHENDGTPFDRLGANGTPHCGRCARARKSIEQPPSAGRWEAEARLAADVHALIPESASKQAAMDKAGRSQLRALVNNRVPSHLLGTEIASVKACMLDTAIEVEVVGDTKGVYVVSEKELNDAGLTVAKAVALWR